MNRDELDKRHTAAITRWFVTMRDTAKVPGQLLDDLAGIADEHARQHAERVIARRELREEAATPPLVAADTGVTAGGPGHPYAVLADGGTIVGGGGGSDAPGPAAGGVGASAASSGGPGSARSRTRTRGAGK